MNAALAAAALVLVAAPVMAGPTPSQVATAQAAIRLLPERVSVVLIDPAVDLDENARAAVAGLDGFILKSDRTRVYIIATSQLFTLAESGHPLFLHAVAAVIWHERAHLKGGDETAAQKAEEGIWRTFIRDGKVAERSGLEYLGLMAKRRHD